MRTALLALTVSTAGLLAALALVGRRVEWPPVGSGVRSTPHNPVITTATSPTMTGPPCLERPSRPKYRAEGAAGQEMLAVFHELYQTGQFRLGYCLAEVRVNENGTVDAVRVVRPKNVHERVESAIVGSMKARRYEPATACGRPVPFTISIGVGHCPSQAEGR